MQVQILIPSENQRKFSINVTKDETVASFRRMVANEVKVPEKDFLLIAFGKIMMDKKSDNKAATLFSTYRIRHQTCIFVHINVQETPCKTEVISNPKCNKVERTQTSTRRETNVVTVPFEVFKCDSCHNNDKTLKCLECGCVKCQYKTGDPLICDQCDNYWHLKCAELTRMPMGEYWYCPDCINLDVKVVIGKGQCVNEGVSRKRAIVVRDVDCVIVPSHHVGKIPGIYCGQSWEFRTLAYDWGIHRAKTPSIAGSSLTGAVSLVLSGGLKEDRDDGYQFVFSGTGGQLKGANGAFKKLGMKEDQKLTRYNKALAITCYAPFNDVTGAKALNWRKSRPIRVCRASNRLNTHPEFAPLEGIRYDGLYKVVKYWPHLDKETGFIIWKYLLRRDDQELPPWMALCKSMSTRQGLRMICSDENETKKLVQYTPPKHIQRLITKDRKNVRLWAEIKQMEFWSEYEFLHYLFDTAITCSSNVCPKPIKDPVTTPCGHICCMECLERSQMDQCFTCRTPLPKGPLRVNNNLVRILQSLNWAYGMEHSEVLPSTFLEDIPLEKAEEDLDFDIKQEFEYPSLSESISSTTDVNTKRSKEVRIIIEYLGDSSEGQKKRQKIY